MRDKLEVQAVISKCSILTPLQLCIYEMGLLLLLLNDEYCKTNETDQAVSLLICNFLFLSKQKSPYLLYRPKVGRLKDRVEIGDFSESR
jgi:hypothetical protein